MRARREHAGDIAAHVGASGRSVRVTLAGGDPDATLVSAAAKGDRAAFATLLDRHYDRIHGLAWQLTGSRADAEDVAQDVCCALVEKIGSFRGDARFTTWLCGIVVNACRDFHRRRRSFRGMTERLAVLTGLARAPDGRDLHDAVWVRSAVARLKPVYRETVVLVVGQQLSHGEAAEILGVGESTVSWRMHEVRRLLAPEQDG
jgi:RNA polymerase sigma-70 factor (ECF subfamily)